MPVDAGPRRRDAEATRALILDAARTLFAQEGYAPTTVRRIADAARVSPNLITRYFGGKEGLFLAAARPSIADDDVYAGALAHLGERLARSIAERWAGQVGEDPLLVLLRAAGEHPGAATALARFLDERSSERLERYLRDEGLEPADAAARADAIDVLVLGVSMRHRVLRPDLLEAPGLERRLAAAIQRLATGT